MATSGGVVLLPLARTLRLTFSLTFPERGRRDRTGKEEEAGLFKLKTHPSQRPEGSATLIALPEDEVRTSTAGRGPLALEGDGSEGGGGAHQGSVSDARGSRSAAAARRPAPPKTRP